VKVGLVMEVVKVMLVGYVGSEGKLVM